jgi:hypothetical protein
MPLTEPTQGGVALPAEAAADAAGPGRSTAAHPGTSAAPRHHSELL